jgi:group I intron endonuclease
MKQEIIEPFKNTYTIYKHTCPDGKVYIGQTKQEPKTRWCSGYGYKNNERFFTAIRKYGWSNIKHEILYTNLNKDDADLIEKDLIKHFRSNKKEYGYNIENGGGKGKIITQETRKKLSEANKGKKTKEARKLSTKCFLEHYKN